MIALASGVHTLEPGCPTSYYAGGPGQTAAAARIQVQLSIRSVDKPQSLIWMLLGTCSVLLLSALKLDAQQEAGHPAWAVCRCKMQDLLQASPCHEASTHFRHLCGCFSCVKHRCPSTSIPRLCCSSGSISAFMQG